jgi:hypothetical protein
MKMEKLKNLVNKLSLVWPSLLILALVLVPLSQPVQAASALSPFNTPPANKTAQAERTIYLTDLDFPSVDNMTFHFLAPAEGEFGPGKIRAFYGAQKWTVWFGVTDGELWLYNLPAKDSLPANLQGFFDLLGIDSTVYFTPDGKCWFTALPPWLNMAKYDPDVTTIPVFVSVSSALGQATFVYRLADEEKVVVDLASSSNPSVFGQSVTFTATLSGGDSPTGSVDFKEGSTTLAAAVALSASTAVFTTAGLSVGSHSISAFYSGDAGNDNATSAILTQVVYPELNIVTSSPLPDARVGVAYSQNLLAAGGTTPYSWKLTSGTLPANLALNPDTGALTGVPLAAAGPLSLTFEVTDNTLPTPVTDSQTFSLTILPPSLELTSPLGGENWPLGSSQDITWSSSGVSGNVNLLLSRDGGANWTSLFAGTPNDGSQSWTVNGAATAQARIKVVSVANSAIFDISPANFNLLAPSLRLSSPLGGEKWSLGSSYDITWDSALVNGNVNILLSRDGGSSWATLFGGTPNDGVQNWTVSGIATAKARVKVVSVTTPTLFDASDSNFSILPTLRLTSPNGAETWAVGSTQTIHWTSAGLTGNVNLLISRDGGKKWTSLLAGTPNDGSQSWKVSGNAATQARLKVVSVTNSAVFDISDADFSILAPSLTLTSPNGAEKWAIGSSYDITWDSALVTGKINILISRNGGSSWTPIFTNTPNDGVQSWTVSGAASSKARVKVVSASNKTVFDTSNANFSLQAPSITVTSPNGGQKWLIGSSHDITWSSVLLSGNVNILYSTNGGTSWTTLVADTPNDGVQAWTVSGPATTRARIKVVSTSSKTLFDVSNSNFSTLPSLTLTSPNGGEDWLLGTTHTITWSSLGLTGSVNLLISRDGGTTWTPLLSNTPNDGAQSWKVTGPATTRARLKVVSSTSTAVNDASDANFSLSAP